MSKMVWRDRFTGTRYVCGEAWRGKVRRYLAGQLSRVVGGGGGGTGTEREREVEMEGAASAVASFWRHSYYERLFPLRFGREVDEAGMLGASSVFGVAEVVDLDRYVRRRLRVRLVDGDRLPPILPDEQMGGEGWLLADRLLVEAALLNVLLLAQKGEVSDGRRAGRRHAIRLAALTYPFRDELARDLPLLKDPLVESVSLILAGKEATLPDSHDYLLKTVQAVRDQKFGEQDKVRLVMVAAQRVKKYVFDTPGLNEIRGGSTLLEQITHDLREQVEEQIGPEVVLRAAGATLVFLAPAVGEREEWPQRLRRAFWKETGTAFTAAAAVDVPAGELLNEYGKAIGKLYREVDIDRAQAKQPYFVTLPFETRCELCQTRAAEGWEAPSGELDLPLNRRPLCRVCKSKRQVGQSERYDQVLKILKVLGHRDYPAALGVKGIRRADWMANDLQSLIAPGVRRTLLGVVYGDGNNFGAVALRLNDLPLGLQWTARVELTTLAAAALSLGQATQEGAKLRGWWPYDDPSTSHLLSGAIKEGNQEGEVHPLIASARESVSQSRRQRSNEPVLNKIPFQVLALGGDDISLFAWAPVAVHFAAEFTRLTDIEFKEVAPKEQEKDQDQDKEECLYSGALTFSLGVLLTDENTPVVKSVDFTESQLLKWAKNAVKSHQLDYGTIAMLYAPTAESVPADLELYREQMFLLGAGQNIKLCTTLRPYSAEELQMLLEVATHLVEQGNLGRYQRLVGSFYGARQSALLGLLHYAYQQGRSSSQTWIQKLEKALLSAGRKVNGDINGKAHDDEPLALLVKYPVQATRTPFGLPPEADENQQTPWFSPLWDLLELAKLMT